MPRRKSPVDQEWVETHQCSITVRLDVLGRVPFFAGLAPAKLREVNALFHETGYGPGDVIYRAGDPAARLYVVASGKVKLVQHTLAGQDVLLEVLAPGEAFGNLSTLGDETYPHTAIAHTALCLLGIGAEEFRRVVAAHPPVALAAVDMLAERLIAAHEQVQRLSAGSAQQRIAYTLVKLAQKLGTPRDVGLLIQLPLSRDELAQMTGTTTETASRVVSQFRKAGLIRTGRQWIAVADLAGLEALA